MVCRCIRISILPRGDRGSDITLIRNSGAKYLFGIAHNETQRVGKNENKAWSEKEIVPLASWFYSPLHGSVPAPPHAVGPPSPSVPLLIAVATPTMAERKSAGTSDRIHLSSQSSPHKPSEILVPHTTRITPRPFHLFVPLADGCRVTIVANC
jgi:hypothetical protein